jgi:hypothetical protein
MIGASMNPILGETFSHMGARSLSGAIYDASLIRMPILDEFNDVIFVSLGLNAVVEIWTIKRLPDYLGPLKFQSPNDILENLGIRGASQSHDGHIREVRANSVESSILIMIRKEYKREMFVLTESRKS